MQDLEDCWMGIKGEPCPTFALSPCSHPLSDQATQLDMGLASEMLLFNQDEEPSSLSLTFEDEDISALFQQSYGELQAEYQDEGDYRCRTAFKESFINRSQCQGSSKGDKGSQISGSCPSSTSMIDIEELSSKIAPTSFDIKVQDASACRKSSCRSAIELKLLQERSRAILGMPTCSASAGVKLKEEFVTVKVKLEEDKTAGLGTNPVTLPDCELGDVAIDICCKGETLASEDDEEMPDPFDSFLWDPDQRSCLEDIPATIPATKLPLCSGSSMSAETPSRPLKRARSEESVHATKPPSRLQSPDILPQPSTPPTPSKANCSPCSDKDCGGRFSLTRKLLISLSSASMGPVSQKELEAASMGSKPSDHKTAPAEKAPVQKKQPRRKQRAKANREASLKASELKTAPERPASQRRAVRLNRVGPAGAPEKVVAVPKRRRGPNSKAIMPLIGGQICVQCSTHVTPVWRHGPEGPKTLCNACGVRYMKGTKRK